MKAVLQWVLKTMMKDQTGIVRTMPKKDLVDFNVAMTAERLMRNGVDPNSLKNANQVENAINMIENRPKVQEGIKSTKSAKVFDLEGKEIDPKKGIMGGKQIPDDDLPPPGSRGGSDDIAAPVQSADESLRDMTEAEIKKRLEKQNKEAAKRFKDKMKDDPEDMAKGGRAGFKSGSFLFKGAKKLGKKYKGSTLEALLENPKLLGTELSYEGIMELLRMGGMMQDGGRAGFKIGSIDKARRAFLKTMGAAGAGITALKTGLLSIGKGAAGKKAVEQVVTTPSVPGKPEWFDALVNKVILEGEDVTKQFGYKERMKVHTKPISETEEVTVYRDLDDGSVRVNYGKKLKIDDSKPYERGNIGRATNDPDQIDLIVREGENIEPDLTTGKGGGKTKASFEASEAEPRAVGGPEDADIEFDGIREVENVDDLMQDVSSLEEFATGKKLTGEKAAKAKKKREDFQRFSEDQVEQAEYLENKYGPYDDSAMDDFASGGIARLLGE